MCERYCLYDAEAALRKFFGEVEPTFAVQQMLRSAGRTIEPMRKAPIVRISESGGRPELAVLNWGLLPSWSDGPEVRNRKISASARTVANHPMFSEAFHRRRCLVLADGFFEWHRVRGIQTRFRTTLAQGGSFAFAGIWERWTPNSCLQQPTETFAIVVANSAADVGADDFETPIIIKEKDYLVWLKGESVDAAKLINSASSERLIRYPIEGRVSPREDCEQGDPKICAPPARIAVGA